jgi:hypothetical protein
MSNEQNKGKELPRGKQIMRKQTTIILSLLVMLALASAALAVPPPPQDKAAMKMQKQRISGMVESVQGQKATIRTEGGKRVQVNLGPQSYWQKKGYHLNPGRQITVEGWRGEDNDNGPFFAGGIWGPDFYFELTNDSGFPYWADQDDYWDGWCPTYDYYDAYYDGPAPYAYGPPPPWWWGPPPPRWWYRHHHYFGRPGFRWGWEHRDGPGYWQHDRRNDNRHDGGWRNDRRNDRHDDRRDNRPRDDRRDDGDRGDQRRGGRGH